MGWCEPRTQKGGVGVHPNIEPTDGSRPRPTAEIGVRSSRNMRSVGWNCSALNRRYEERVTILSEPTVAAPVVLSLPAIRC